VNIKTYWDKNNNPIDSNMSDIIYQLRREDGHHKLMFDSLSVADILENERVISMDSLTSLFSKLEPRMTALMRVMERNAVNIKPLSMTITEPFKRNGSLQVGVIFELSDGQSITVFFHNPDVDKKSIKGTDTLTSWKWLLNKKDITILVAPERGKDIVLKDVAIRMMKIAEKNAKAFEKNNKNKAERAKQIDGLKTEITGLESELKGLESDLEAAKIDKEEQASKPVQNDEEIKGNKELQNPIDPVAEKNIQQAGLSKALNKKVIDHLKQNPDSKTLPSPKALKIIGENTIRELGAELEGNGFEKKGANEWSNDSFKTTISVIKDKTATTGYKIIINGNSAVSLDATKTIKETKLWNGALPFDLDVKAFVADIVLNMSVVDDEPLIEEISTPIEAPSEDGEVIKEDEGMIEKLAQEPDEQIEDISKDEGTDDAEDTAVGTEPEPTFKSLDQEEEDAILETIPLNADQEGTFNVNVISVGRKWIKANFEGKSFNIQIAINPVSKNWKAGDKVSFFGKKHVKKNKYATVTTLYPVRGDDKIKEQRNKIQKINDGAYGDLTIKGTENGYDVTFDYDEELINSLKELIPEDLRGYSNKVWFVDTLATDKLVELINKFDSGESTQDEVEPEGDNNEVKTSKGETTSFINELDELMNEDDPKLLGDKLDVIADRIEEAGLMDELEPKLNEVADRITLLLKEIEDNSEVA